MITCLTFRSLRTVVAAISLAAVSAGCVLAAPPAQHYKWRNVEIGGGGGFVDGIVFSPVQPDVIYCRTDIGGAYRWDAKTRRWIALTDWVGQANGNMRGAESIACDPTNSQRVYIAAGTYRNSGAAAILRSYDQGKTWHTSVIPVAMGGNEDGRNIGERLDVDPDMPSDLYFGSRHDGLWMSTDFGGTWKSVASFPAVPDAAPRTGGFGFRRGGPPSPAQIQAGIGFIVFDPAGSRKGWPTNTIYVGVASATIPELYRSTDAGATWSAVPGQPTGLLPQHAALDKDGMLYITYGNNLGPNGITDGAVWKYDTKSNQWTDITPEKATSDSPGGYCGLSIDAEHTGTVMVSTLDHWRPSDEIFRSTDGGAHWVGLQQNSVRDATGAPWLIWGNPEPRFGWWIAALAIDPFHPGRVLYGTGATIWGAEDVTNADAGQPTHWKDYALGLEETAATALVSPPAGPHLISGVGDIGGFTHHDLNVSPPEGMHSNPIFTTTSSLDFAEDDPAIVVRAGSAGNGSPGGAISTDFGTTWSPFATSPTGSRGSGSIAITADGKSIIWASGGAPVAFSLDHGVTWTASAGLPQPDPSAPRSYFGQGRISVFTDRVNVDKVYALDTNATSLYISTDGGASFTLDNSSLPTGRVNIKAAPGHEGDLWMTDSDQGLFHSINSGATFSGLLNVPEADGIGFGKAKSGSSYPALYMVGAQNDIHGVFRSDDSGATWIRINDDDHQYGWIGEPITGDPRVYGRVYLGTNGRGILYADPA